MKELKMIFSLLILTLFFTSCDSDLNPDPDPCDAAMIFALETSDPYSWLSDFNSRVSDETVVTWSPPNLVSPPGFGVNILPASNVSTYNYDLESYHYYERSTNNFISIEEGGAPVTIAPQTGGINGWTISGLVYVSGTATNYVMGVGPLGQVGIIEVVNIYTGEVADTPYMLVSGFTFGSFIEGQEFIKNLSVATDNSSSIYGVSKYHFFSFDFADTFGEHEWLLSSSRFYGLEYNNNDNSLYALQLETENAKLVKINPLTATITSSSSDLISAFPQFISSIDFYNSTLTCNESNYILAHRYTNASTRFNIIDFSSGVASVTTSDVTSNTEPSYYFGIESNGNN